MVGKMVGRLLPVLAMSFALSCTSMGTGISSTEARQLVSQGAQLVDVRTADEFRMGHLNGALNIPVDQLERRLGELPDKSARIILYCHSGARSARASHLLKTAGYTAVRDLGGMRNW